MDPITNRSPLFIGIDGGGTKCKATIVDKKGNVLGTGLGGAANPFHDQPLAINSIIAAAQQALADANLPNTAIAHLTAGVGLAGVNVPSVFNSMSKWQHPFTRMHLTTDLRIACLGAHNGDDGAIIITGTGSCGYSYVNGKTNMLGGHGFPHGDKGSGAWFGFKAVENVLLSLDGLVPHSIMNNLLLEQLNAKTPLDIVETVAKKNATFFASLAHIAITAAANNDALALTIIKEGTHYLSLMARTLQQDNPPKISLIGGLQNALLLYLDKDVVSVLSKPVSPPEIGATLFAQLTSKTQQI